MTVIPPATQTYRINVPTPTIARRADPAALRNALVAEDDGNFRFRGFRLLATGLQADDEMGEQDWLDLGAALTALQGRLQWLIGDWLLIGEHKYGFDVAALAEYLGYEVKTLYEWTYVCRAVDFSIRMEKLSFGHHQVVAALNAEDQRAWLEYAAERVMSVKQLRAELKNVLQSPGGKSPNIPSADSPTTGDSGLWGDDQGTISAIITDRTQESGELTQMTLFSDAEWRAFARRVERIRNAGTGKLRLTRAQLIDDIDAQIAALQALRQQVGG